MDERVEKAFAVANYMATLSNQKRIIKEEFDQKLAFYINGGTFSVTPDLIAFTKSLVDLGHTQEITFIDLNKMPIMISDVQKFLQDIVSVYFEAVNEYSSKHAEIKSKRKLSDIVDL
jgi:hypothetical protein